MIARILPAALILTACTAVGPEYQQPTAPIAARFASGGATTIGEVSAQRWWLAFNDTVLNTLVDRGLAQNLDVQSALSRVAEAQASARATGMSAQISGTISGSAMRSGGDAIAPLTTRQAGFAPALIIDLFGGTARAREQALAQLEAAQLDVGTARLAYLSSLVSTYIDLRYYQQALAISRQTIASRRETLALVQRQERAGTATALSVAQSQASLDEARASLPSLEQGFYSATYAIATLLAEPVQTLQPMLERGAAQPTARGNARAGVPAELLRNRPDVRSAERTYAAAVANVGVAEADLYPSLSLGGTITTSGGTTWSFGPSLSIPVLNQPVLRANRDRAIAQAKQAELTWKAAVLSAVEEVQVAQSDLSRNARAVAATRRSVNSYTQVVTLSRQTYQAGTTTLLDLLESQRSLATANLSLASVTRDLAASWARVQIASGKGWAIGGK